MNDWIYKETAYLTESERKHNANFIFDYFRAQGWTKESIAGMLGNIEVESTINPGLWQGREVPVDIYTTDKGYGFSRWCPLR